MHLYLLRHGVAEERTAWRGDDDLRPLTPKGERGVERVAALLTNAGVAPAVIISSPLARAEMTARIVAESLGAPVVTDELLAGPCLGRDLPGLLARVDGGDVMLVGHEPTMSVLLEDLTGARTAFKKGACARVDLDGPGAAAGVLAWLVTPGLAAP